MGNRQVAVQRSIGFTADLSLIFPPCLSPGNGRAPIPQSLNRLTQVRRLARMSLAHVDFCTPTPPSPARPSPFSYQLAPFSLDTDEPALLLSRDPAPQTPPAEPRQSLLS